jgi:hypothetical protein
MPDGVNQGRVLVDHSVPFSAGGDAAGQPPSKVRLFIAPARACVKPTRQVYSTSRQSRHHVDFDQGAAGQAGDPDAGSGLPGGMSVSPAPG